MKTKLLSLLIFSLISFQISAQIINVNSSSYSSSSPLECNNFIVTVNGVKNCINFQFDSTSFSIVGNNIEVGLYFTGGPACAGALSPFSYPVNLGNVPQGTYTMLINGYLNLNVDDVLNAPNVTFGSCCGTDASFTSNKTVGCTDDTDNFIFTNTSTGNTSNEWYLNNLLVSSSSNFTIPSNTIGSYKIKLITSDGICLDSMVQVFNVFQSPNISLGNDTTSCDGLNHSIITNSGFSSYSWTNNSSNSNTAIVMNTNTYKVTATDANGCSAEDSVLVTFNALPVFTLGNDTNICAGEIFTLDPGLFSSYNWNTNETTQTINVTNTFSYSVEVTDANGCKKSDAIGVLVNSAPNVDIGLDTTEICVGSSATLNAGNFNSYLWSTAETSSTISVSMEGLVNVNVTNANGCSNSDETYIKLNDLPLVSLGADTIGFCSGSSVMLDAGTFSSYNWSTFENTQTISVSNAGDYSVTVQGSNNCSNIASIYVEENQLPSVDLGEDMELCITDKITLNGGSFASYLWSDASTLPSLEVNGADFSLGNNSFNLTGTDGNGCNGTDEIVINVKECDVAISSLALENNITIYPIPAQNILNIQIAKNVKSDIRIYNVLGKEIKIINAQTLNSKSSIDISEFIEGVYIIEITINNERLVKQFLKTK